jgi:flavin reductase (DIM6/NTAB) family NADH-FMN oxidoreductase RutF
LHADALGVADCVVRQAVDVGDHRVVFGEVVHVLTVDGDPLLYGRRRFRRVDHALSVVA